MQPAINFVGIKPCFVSAGNPRVLWQERRDNLAASAIGGLLVLGVGELVTSQNGTDKPLAPKDRVYSGQ